MFPPAVLRQDIAGVEGRAVAAAAMLLDIPTLRTSLDSLSVHRGQLAEGALPVGSVEFVREAMRIGEVPEPAPMSYPPALDYLLRRRVEPMKLADVRGRQFVKPQATKLFTGFVWDESAKDVECSEHDREQRVAIRSLPGDTAVWVADPVHFLSEWRFYVLHGEVLGAARYDSDGDDDAPEPDIDVVEFAIQEMDAAAGAPLAYALDVGVLAGGVTALVEANDAWAIGLYSRALKPKAYLRFLAARWQQLRALAQGGGG